MAVLSLVLAVLWGLGFFSLVATVLGFGSWSFLRNRDHGSNYVWVALAGAVLGLVGFIVTIVAFAAGAL